MTKTRVLTTEARMRLIVALVIKVSKTLKEGLVDLERSGCSDKKISEIFIAFTLLEEKVLEALLEVRQLKKDSGGTEHARIGKT